VRVVAWLSPTLIVLATLIAIAAALLTMWWLVAAMVVVCVGQLWAIRTRRRA
jgi:hypothetical protein